MHRAPEAAAHSSVGLARPWVPSSKPANRSRMPTPFARRSHPRSASLQDQKALAGITSQLAVVGRDGNPRLPMLDPP
jgi:hypothetical protein